MPVRAFARFNTRKCQEEFAVFLYKWNQIYCSGPLWFLLLLFVYFITELCVCMCGGVCTLSPWRSCLSNSGRVPLSLSGSRHLWSRWENNRSGLKWLSLKLYKISKLGFPNWVPNGQAWLWCRNSNTAVNKHRDGGKERYPPEGHAVAVCCPEPSAARSNWLFRAGRAQGLVCSEPP